MAERRSQILARLPGYGIGVLHDGLERPVLGKPLGSRLRTDAGYAGNVIRRVARER